VFFVEWTVSLASRSFVTNASNCSKDGSKYPTGVPRVKSSCNIFTTIDPDFKSLIAVEVDTTVVGKGKEPKRESRFYRSMKEGDA
jgi:hypothetical protein|tara:strand:- start:50 stop:304 length:255 start_codon:yes stop_codon:yes gene_type:complete